MKFTLDKRYGNLVHFTIAPTITNECMIVATDGWSRIYQDEYECQHAAILHIYTEEVRMEEEEVEEEDDVEARRDYEYRIRH